MASPNVWVGPLATAGPAFASLGSVFLKGTLRFVDSITGSDANTGLTPGSPKKTWSATVTASSADDVILLAPGFSETITTTVTVSVANLTTISAGAGATQAQLINGTVAGTYGVALSAANARFYGVSFPAATGTQLYKFQSASTGAVFDSCSFACGLATEVGIRATAGSGLTLRNCTFSSTLGSSGLLTDVCVNVTLSGLTFTGTWADYAVKIASAAPTGLDVRDVALSNKAGFNIAVTGGTYSIFGLRAIDSSPCPIVIAA